MLRAGRAPQPASREGSTLPIQAEESSRPIMTSSASHQRSRLSAAIALCLAALGLLPAAATAQDLASFAARTTVHVVANGWTFILVERHEAPVFSFCTVADVGSAQEVPGITGLAHMMEHMAFKGSDHIGTRDPVHEKVAMDA